MFKTKSISTALLLILSVICSQSYAVRTAPLTLDRGSDEGARFFSVLCVNGKRTSIRANYEDYNSYKAGDICYHDKDGKAVCKKATLQEVAIMACRS